jgi:hypothetical protein
LQKNDLNQLLKSEEENLLHIEELNNIKKNLENEIVQLNKESTKSKKILLDYENKL